jgi:hypothetical protein
MFQPLLGHHQVYHLCFGAERFLVWIHILFKFDHLIRDICLVTKLLVIYSSA